MLSKVPPNAPEIEAAVLGAALINSSVLPIVISRIFPEAFYQPNHVTIFTAIISLYDKNKPVDIETLCHELKAMKKLRLDNSIEGIDTFYIAQLTNKITSVAGIETHINILLEFYMKRQTIAIAMYLIEESYEAGSDPFDTNSKANDELLKIHETVLKGSEKTMSHFVMNVANNRDAVLQKGSIGLSTGFNELNKIIGGLVSPDLIIIAARPGMGETALMLTIIYYLSGLSNIPGAVFSLEMSGEQLTERLESIGSNIYHQKLRYNQLSDYDKLILQQTEIQLSKSPLYIQDKAGITIRDVRTKASLLKRKYNIQYLMIDYL